MKRIIIAALIAGIGMPAVAVAQDGYRGSDSEWQRQQAYRDQQYNDRYYDRDGRRYYRNDCRRSKGTTGTIAGGAGGALIGGAIGGDALGAVIGGVGGALLGRTLDKNHDRAEKRRQGC